MPTDLSSANAFVQNDPRTLSRGRSRSASFYERRGKRIFDITFAIVLLPILMPAIGLLCMLVKTDGGRGFYCQDRIGRQGRVFRFWKLRTMVPDAAQVLTDLCEQDDRLAREWALNQKLTRDPRVTKVGRFLRATSLDELPQIWNVLRGDMSFVGPRPFMVSQKAPYQGAGGRRYFHMRPGITGPWQVSGRGDTPFLGRIRYDDFYARTLSLGHDLEYMRRTIGVVFKRTGR